MRPIVYEELKVGDEVVTRNGLKGRVICVDANPNDHGADRFPICCLIDEHGDGAEYPNLYLSNGGISCTSDNSGDIEYLENPMDIFLPPKKESVYIWRNKQGEYLISRNHDFVFVPDTCESEYGFEMVETVDIEV